MALRSPIYGLGIDTSTAVLTLALGSQTDSTTPRIGFWSLERAMSAQLHPHLRDFMPPQQWSDLAWIAVLKGPGSFTGTRLGVVTARTLAQQLQVPLFGFSNLAIAAWIAAEPHAATDWTVALSQAGQQGTVYGAVYRVAREEGALLPIIPDQLFSLADWQKLLNVVQEIDQVLAADASTLTLSPPLGQALLSLGWNAWNRGERPDWESVLPYYG